LNKEERTPPRNSPQH